MSELRTSQHDVTSIYRLLVLKGYDVKRGRTRFFFPSPPKDPCYTLSFRTWVTNTSPARRRHLELTPRQRKQLRQRECRVSRLGGGPARPGE